MGRCEVWSSAWSSAWSLELSLELSLGETDAAQGSSRLPGDWLEVCETLSRCDLLTRILSGATEGFASTDETLCKVLQPELEDLRGAVVLVGGSAPRLIVVLKLNRCVQKGERASIRALKCEKAHRHEPLVRVSVL